MGRGKTGVVGAGRIIVAFLGNLGFKYAAMCRYFGKKQH